MKKRLLVELMSISMVILLAGCKEETAVESKTHDRTAKEETAKDVVVIDDAEEEVEEEVVEEEAEEEPELNEDMDWQQAYMSLLQNAELGIFDKSAPYYGYSASDEEYENICEELVVDSYYLYDIDKDDVPELIVKYGTCEADYDAIVYAYNENTGDAEAIDEMVLGHTSLLTYPEANGVVLQWGHMGVQYVQLAKLVDGELEYEDIFDEELPMDDYDATYTPVSQYVRGAMYLTGSEAGKYAAISEYRSWSEKLYGDIPVTYKPGEEEESEYLNIIYNNGEVIGVGTDGGFTGDTGRMNYDDYIAVGGFDPYTDVDYKTMEYAFTDFNGDGVTDCILRLANGEGEGSNQRHFVILSKNKGAVYAYSLKYFAEDMVALENGSFRWMDDIGYGYDECSRLVLAGEDYYKYNVAEDEKHAELLYTPVE